jgi:hypothetical protein
MPTTSDDYIARLVRHVEDGMTDAIGRWLTAQEGDSESLTEMPPDATMTFVTVHALVSDLAEQFAVNLPSDLRPPPGFDLMGELPRIVYEVKAQEQIEGGVVPATVSIRTIVVGATDETRMVLTVEQWQRLEAWWISLRDDQRAELLALGDHDPLPPEYGERLRTATGMGLTIMGWTGDERVGWTVRNPLWAFLEAKRAAR